MILQAMSAYSSEFYQRGFIGFSFHGFIIMFLFIGKRDLFTIYSSVVDLTVGCTHSH